MINDRGKHMKPDRQRFTISQVWKYCMHATDTLGSTVSMNRIPKGNI